MKNKTILTRKQRAFYDGLVDFQTQHGYAPPLAEMTFAGCKSAQAAHFYCKKLVELGWIKQIGEAYIPNDSPLNPKRSK